MAVFVNTYYRERAAIVSIIATGEKLTAKDYHRDVKKFFKIKGNVKFYDYKSGTAISNAILPVFLDQFRTSAGWFLGVADRDDGDYSEDDDDVQDGRTNIRLLMSADILTNLCDLEFKVLKGSHTATKCLKNSQQVKLAKIVVKFILENDITMEFHQRDFSYLSDVVCQVFSGQVKEVYYTKSTNGQNASGKLYDAYANYRRQLGCCGLLKRRKYSASKNNATNTDVDAKIKVLDTVASVDLNYVKKNTKPSAEYLEKWEDCLSDRLKLLKDCNLSVIDYMKLFPILEVNNAYIFELCLSDVKSLYPISKSCEHFDDFYGNILERGSKMKGVRAQKWVNTDANSCEYTKRALAFLMLPYLFPSIIVKGRETKQSYKPKKVEVQEKFALYYESPQGADALNQRNTELPVAGPQPLIVFVGANGTLASYVTFLGKKYHFENPVEAVQNCVSLYLALKIPYPAESAIVWYYVQKYIFGVSTAHDINNSSIKSVHQQLTSSI